MPRTILLPLFLLAPAGIAGQSQGFDPNNPPDSPIEEQVREAEERERAQAEARAAAEAAGQEPPPPPLTLDEARMNAATVVQSFVARKSPQGYWPFREKGSGTLYKLKLVSIDEKKVKELSQGRYGVPALLEDAGAGTRLRMEFVVDLGESEWKVSGLRLRKKEPLKGRKSAPGSSRS